MKNNHTMSRFGAWGFGLLAVGLYLGSHVSSADAQSVQTGYTGQADRALTSLRTSQDLTIGSSGQTVANLQGLLIELGHLQIDPISIPLGYFGTMTRDALARFQTSIGVSPASGYFGPITKTTLTTWINQSGNPLSLYNQAPSQTQTQTGTGQQQSTSMGTMNPLSSTGYWYEGSWYNSVPSSTTTASAIDGYWQNGAWTSTNNVQQNSSLAFSNQGYWYNGTWYQADPDDRNIGYFSSGPSSSGSN